MEINVLINKSRLEKRIEELAKNIKSNVEMEFMDVSSYEGTESTGNIKINSDIRNSIKGKDVIIVEDIIDTGRTLTFLIDYLKQKEPNSLKIATMLSKPSRRILELNVDYIGFSINDEFVVGYGLDYNEKYRNLPYIGYFE